MIVFVFGKFYSGCIVGHRGSKSKGREEAVRIIHVLGVRSLELRSFQDGKKCTDSKHLWEPIIIILKTIVGCNTEVKKWECCVQFCRYCLAQE